MDSKIPEARTEIEECLELLRGIFRKKPDPFMQPLHIIFDVKADEIINVFSESFPEEKNRLFELLTEIDQANAGKYKKILETTSY